MTMNTLKRVWDALWGRLRGEVGESSIGLVLLAPIVLLAGFGLTEPEAGSDVAAMQCSATEDGDAYLLNGEKTWISNGGIADLYVVFCRTGEAPGARGISAFAVPADSAGIAYGRKEEKMGWNSQPTRQIAFDEVRVPAGNLLGGTEGIGFGIAASLRDAAARVAVTGLTDEEYAAAREAGFPAYVLDVLASNAGIYPRSGSRT